MSDTIDSAETTENFGGFIRRGRERAFSKDYSFGRAGRVTNTSKEAIYLVFRGVVLTCLQPGETFPSRCTFNRLSDLLAKLPVNSQTGKPDLSAPEIRQQYFESLRAGENLHLLDGERVPSDYTRFLGSFFQSAAVIDLGCGTVGDYPFPNLQFSRYLGVDISPSVVSAMSAKLELPNQFPTQAFIVGDLMELPAIWDRLVTNCVFQFVLPSLIIVKDVLGLYPDDTVSAILHSLLGKLEIHKTMQLLVTDSYASSWSEAVPMLDLCDNRFGVAKRVKFDFSWMCPAHKLVKRTYLLA